MSDYEEMLRIKLAANQQRRHREEYLAELPERLGTYLEKRPFTQSPELDAIALMFCISPNGILQDSEDSKNTISLKPAGYTYREFSWLNQLFDAAISVGDRHDHEIAYFSPFSGPLYHVPFGWVRKNIVQRFFCKWLTHDYGVPYKYCPESLGVVTMNYAVGLVLDNYCGYLEKDPNPDETVYKLAAWGFD